MRSFQQRGTLIACAVLLGTALLPAGALARRPVVAPGQEVPTKPPPPPELAPTPEEQKPAAAGSAETTKPAEPPKPLDFNDAGQLVQPIAPPASARELGPHKELRYTRRVGDFVYVVHARPGEPRPGAPIELFLRVNELLPIPDPALGDRRPLEGGRITVRVRGSGFDRTFRTHELLDAGTYGAHFSVPAAGVYTLTIERTDGRRPQTLDLALGVGVPTPGVQTAEDETVRRRDRSGVVEGIEMVGVAGPDASTIGGVMDELGRRWIELDRTAGTPEAAEALHAVREQAALVAGKMPQVQGANAAEFDQLAATLIERVAALEASAGDRDALLGGMLRVQEEVCMRCHAMYRHRIADSVATWPDFRVREKLEPPAESAPATTRTRTRTPFAK